MCMKIVHKVVIQCLSYSHYSKTEVVFEEQVNPFGGRAVKNAQLEVSRYCKRVTLKNNDRVDDWR